MGSPYNTLLRSAGRFDPAGGGMFPKKPPQMPGAPGLVPLNPGVGAPGDVGTPVGGAAPGELPPGGMDMFPRKPLPGMGSGLMPPPPGGDPHAPFPMPRPGGGMPGAPLFRMPEGDAGSNVGSFPGRPGGNMPPPASFVQPRRPRQPMDNMTRMQRRLSSYGSGLPM